VPDSFGVPIKLGGDCKRTRRLLNEFPSIIVSHVGNPLAIIVFGIKRLILNKLE
jgi:hypothetical protein